MKKILTLLIIVICISCQPDNDNEPISQKEPVYTGKISEKMISYYFEGGYILSYEWSACGYGEATDSIDLLNDRTFDIRLSSRFLNQDLFWNAECCPPPMDCWPYGIELNIKLQNDYEIAIYDTIVYEGFPGNLASNFSLNIRVDTISKWTNSTHFWTDTFGLIGPWYRIESDNYIAIRKQIDGIYKYGWIKIGPAPYGNLTFKEYALEKF